MHVRRWIGDEGGLALITVLVITLITTSIGIALVGLMNTDLTHAGVQHAKARSFYVAQAGLEEAKAQVFAASDPLTYTTASAGVTSNFGDGRFTYWVDNGTTVFCGVGLKTLEAEGEVGYLAFTIRSRVAACGIPGAPFLTSIFGVSLVETQGATSHTYVAPVRPSVPGAPRGGHIGSFYKINFDSSGPRLNSLSEQNITMLTLREGTIEDYRLFGFTSRPIYETNANIDATPWILSVFGDIVKAQPTTGPIPNPCGTYFACVSVGNQNQDVASIADLRQGAYGLPGVQNVYMNRITQQVVPRLSSVCPNPDPMLPQFCVDPDASRTEAANNPYNSDNAAVEAAAGMGPKTYAGSVYTSSEFDSLVTYLSANCPPRCLRGTIYVDGSYTFTRSVNLGGDTGNVTLAVRGDLVLLSNNIVVVNRHDITNTDQAAATAARRLPGILVFGLVTPLPRPTNVCRGEQADGSGRLIVCGGSNQLLIADGMLYTQEGLFVGSSGTVDLIGALYNDNRSGISPSSPSFTNQNATIVVRFDPLSLSFFRSGLAIVSWQQLR